VEANIRASSKSIIERRKPMNQKTRMDHTLITTNIQLDGYRVVKNLGVVRGIIVRSRSIIGNIGAGFQILFGGNISLYSQLCEQTRSDAYELMIRHAEEFGANAILAFRYDATEIAAGVTEVLAYGTAVVVEKI
jgi:uncharacterized protein YbjQ (UPF0145 family)